MVPRAVDFTKTPYLRIVEGSTMFFPHSICTKLQSNHPFPRDVMVLTLRDAEYPLVEFAIKIRKTDDVWRVVGPYHSTYPAFRGLQTGDEVYLWALPRSASVVYTWARGRYDKSAPVPLPNELRVFVTNDAMRKMRVAEMEVEDRIAAEAGVDIPVRGRGRGRGMGMGRGRGRGRVDVQGGEHVQLLRSIHKHATDASAGLTMIKRELNGIITSIQPLLD